jgi:hypothetical protein
MPMGTQPAQWRFPLLVPAAVAVLIALAAVLCD